MKKSFETILVEQCAPTLAGVKPANLFRYEGENEAQVCQLVRHWSQQLHVRGIALCIIKRCAQTNVFLIYMYRNDRLNKILMEPEHQRFLAKNGYPQASDCQKLLATLAKRLYLEQEFPHEIGLFLGYPLCDVVGFIEHKGRNYTYSGHWKAYGDPVTAQKRFALYKKCTSIYKRMLEMGTPIINFTPITN